MGAESCNIPDNTFNNLDIQLPTEFREGILNETKSELLDCFIESLNIQADSDIFLEYFKHTLKIYGSMDFQRISQLDSQYIREIIQAALGNLGDSNNLEELEEFIDLESIDYRAYIIINGVSINFLSYFDKNQVKMVWKQLYESGEKSEEDNILNEWSTLEGEVGFQENRNNGMTLSEALIEYGFTENTIQSINTIFGRELDTEEIKNLTNMIRYFLEIESSGGYNVANYEGVSTARGYFQYLTGNGRLDGDTWLSNSYETGLNRIPEEVFTLFPLLQGEREKQGAPENQNPMNLSAEEQIILFLSDLRKRPGVRSYIELMLQGNIDAVEELYRKHHTNTDDETEYLMRLAKRDIYGVEIKIFERDGNALIGNIFPGTNTTIFFTELITEFNPNTRLSQTDIMLSLRALGNLRFPAGGRVRIRKSETNGIAYNIELNEQPYLEVSNSGIFMKS